MARETAHEQITYTTDANGWIVKVQNARRVAVIENEGHGFWHVAGRTLPVDDNGFSLDANTPSMYHTANHNAEAVAIAETWVKK